MKAEDLDSTGRRGGAVVKRRKHHLMPDLHLAEKRLDFEGDLEKNGEAVVG